MTNKKEAFTLQFEGQELKLENGFVGGFLADGSRCPMGMYAGNLDIGDMGVALLSTLRACIKMNVEEQGMSLEHAKAFIKFTLETALEIERENREEDNKTVEQHKEMILKFRRDYA